MVFEARLKTSVWISAEIKRCEGLFLSAVVLHKGDKERGLVLIKQYVAAQGCRIYTQTRDTADNLIWHQPLGNEFMTEQKADSYCRKQRGFDEDLWVIEVDDVKGQYTPAV